MLGGWADIGNTASGVEFTTAGKVPSHSIFGNSFMPLALKKVSVIRVKEKTVGMQQVEKSFAAFAAKISKWVGSSTIFISAAALIVVWGASGPYFGFSATWQMIVTSGTAICTFLMVFTIQNSQNRDGLALQIKLDEIIRATGAAQNGMINLDELS